MYLMGGKGERGGWREGGRERERERRLKETHLHGSRLLLKPLRECFHVHCYMIVCLMYKRTLTTHAFYRCVHFMSATLRWTV